jgi:hypothetical protein
MSFIRWDGFSWLMLADGLLAIAFALMIIVTLLTQRLILPRGAYFTAAIVGTLAWLAFITARGEVHLTGSAFLVIVAAFLPSLPFVLLGETAFLFWFGSSKHWRYVLVLGVLVIPLALYFFTRLAKVIGQRL